MPLMDPEDLELTTLKRVAVLPTRRVVEIGTGDGRLAWPLAGSAGLWVALDPDGDELGQAGAAEQTQPCAGVRLLAGDGRALPLASASFDLALFTWSLC